MDREEGMLQLIFWWSTQTVAKKEWRKSLGCLPVLLAGIVCVSPKFSYWNFEFVHSMFISASVFLNIFLLMNSAFKSWIICFLFVMMKSFHFYFKFKIIFNFFQLFYIPLSFPSLLSFCPFPFPTTLSPSTLTLSPFRKGQALNGLIQSMAHQIDDRLSPSPYIEVGSGNLAWGAGY